jgi:predicted transcriptional regulator
LKKSIDATLSEEKAEYFERRVAGLESEMLRIKKVLNESLVSLLDQGVIKRKRWKGKDYYYPTAKRYLDDSLNTLSLAEYDKVSKGVDRLKKHLQPDLSFR